MIELNFKQFQQLLTQDCVQTSREDLARKLYHTAYHTKINSPYLRGEFHSTRVREGITLQMINYVYQQDTKVYLESHPQVGLCHSLEGKSQYLGMGQPRQFFPCEMRDGYLFVVPASDGCHLYQAGLRYRALYLNFSLPAFLQLIGEQVTQLPEALQAALRGEQDHYLEHFKLSPSAVACCEALFTNPYAGRSGQFYTEAKVIELLAYQLDRLIASRQPTHSGALLKPREEELLEECHQRLLVCLQDPPSLMELARQTGLSDYRLKQGFRQKYGLSPFQLVAEQRLLKSRELLLTGGTSVSEVAARVGYSSIGSFSNSFFEKFGVRPSELLNG